jgi:chitinase
MYDFPAMTPYIDFYNVMVYDIHGPWSDHCGHNSPMFQNPDDPDFAGSLKNSSVRYADLFSVPREKLNMGTAFYGYRFYNVSKLWDKCVASNCSSAVTVSFTEVAAMAHRYERNWDPVAKAPYLLGHREFITYDDPVSTEAKVRYNVQQKMGGSFMWEISQDWTGKGTEHPLVDAMVKGARKI